MHEAARARLEQAHEESGLGFSRYCCVVLVHPDANWDAPVLAILYDGQVSVTAAGRCLLDNGQLRMLATLSREIAPQEVAV